MSEYCELCGSTLIDGGCSGDSAGVRFKVPIAEWRMLIRAVDLPLSIKPGAVNNPLFRAAMYRAAGLDPDGEPMPLPKKLESEERPFVPNKFGEH